MQKSGNSVSILRKQKLLCSTKWVDITHYPFCLVTKLLLLIHDYSGITFTPSGSFKLARESLYKKKACKAYYSFLNDINIQSGAQISTMKKLFHTLVKVKPILLYNCEVWGSFLKPRSQALDYFISNMFDGGYYHEALLNKSCKHMLGVHSRSSDDAVRGELGMYPLNVNLK